MFSSFAITVDTVASDKPRELQTLARFSPASIFVITKMAASKVTAFRVIFTYFCKRGQSAFLIDVMGGKITINLKELH